MQIDNKFEIGELVRWGPNTAVIAEIRLAGSNTNILYNISYFDVNDVGIYSIVYEIELEKMSDNSMGFYSKEK